MAHPHAFLDLLYTIYSILRYRRETKAKIDHEIDAQATTEQCLDRRWAWPDHGAWGLGAWSAESLCAFVSTGIEYKQNLRNGSVSRKAHRR